jgi:hypothetical protein
LRYSTQGRILAELALVEIAHLEDLDELPALIAELRAPLADPRGEARQSARPSGEAPERGRKKKREPAGGAASDAAATAAAGEGEMPLRPENAAEVWTRVLSGLSGMAAEHGKHYDRVTVPVPNRLDVQFKSGYALAKSICERPEQVAQFERALLELTGEPVRVEFSVAREEAAPEDSDRPAHAPSPHQRIMEIARHPMIQRAGELFGAHPIGVHDPPRDQ